MKNKATKAISKTPPIATKNNLRYLTWIFCIQVLSITFEAPIRFVLSKVHLTNALYLRDLLILSCIAILALRTPDTKLKDHIRNHSIVLIYALAIALFTTTLIGGSIFSALFEIKIFNTFLFGLTCALLTHHNPRLVLRLATLVFFATCIGIFLNKALGVFPWDGTSYETAFGTVEVNRVWWIEGGERRLAGFCRASYTAAAIIAVTATLLQLQLNRMAAKLAVTILALSAIYLTTSKGVVIALLLTSLISFTKPASSIRVALSSFGAASFAILCAIVPFLSWYLSPPINTVRYAPNMLSSFADRATNTWPGALNEFTHWYHWLIGKGLGGVGIASAFTSSVRVNPIDNLHLYLFGNLGIIGFIFFAILAFQTIRSASRRDNTQITTTAVTVAILLIGYGNVTNILDDAFSPIALGMAWGVLSYSLKSHSDKLSLKKLSPV